MKLHRPAAILRSLPLAASLVLPGAAAQHAAAQDTFVPPPVVVWSFDDSVAACPAGDSTNVPTRPSRLRILVSYSFANGQPRNGVPPESIYAEVGVGTGNVKPNDETLSPLDLTKVHADDSTRVSGSTRITVPSFSGCGKVNLRLYVSGVSQGTRVATIRTVDTNADGRSTAADETGACDMNYSGSVNQADIDIIRAHVDHWKRHALHGTLVKRTAHCDTCAGGPNTVSAEGRISWQPSGRRIVYAIHDPVISGLCNLYIVPSDPAGGNTPQKFTFSDSSDYDPSWSPLGHEIIFFRGDRLIYRKGLPGFAPDTEIGIYEEPSPNFIVSTIVSPDGDSVAFARLINQPPKAFDQVYTTPIIGGQIRQITNAPGVDDLHPHWSPDGKLLIFQRRPLDPPGSRADLYKVSTQGPASEGVLYFQSQNPDQDAVSPSYAPDFQVVLCGLGLTGTAPRKTAVLETAAPVSTIKAITSNYPTHQHNAVDPILSPDGTRLALLAWDPAVPGASGPQVFAARRNMNLPPQFTTIGSHAVADSSTTVSDAPTVGQNFSFTVTAVDPEGDPLSYDAYFLREGMTFTPGTRTFSWTPPPSTVGKTFNVKFIVTTNSGGTDVIIDKLTVQPCCGPQARAVQTDPTSEAVQTGATSDEGPNPTTGRFSLATPRIPGVWAELAVFDQSGRRVARVGGPSGSPLVWEGRGSAGQRLPSGVYWYRLRVGDYEKRGRIVLLR